MPPIVVALKNLSLEKKLRYGFAGVCFLLIIAYLIQTNNQAEYGFTLKQLEGKRSALAEDMRRLTWEVGEARSVARVNERAKKLTLTTPASISFLVKQPAVVAVLRSPDKFSP